MAGKSKKQLPVATLDDIIAADAAVAATVETVEVPQWQRSVRVRGLSRGEVLAVAQMDDRTAGYLHYGLVEPTVTVEQAAAFNDKSFAAVQIVIDRIIELSGLGAGFRQEDAN